LVAKPSHPVLISGAGIAGLATALALAKTGRAVKVFEKAASLDPIGAGLQLSPNAWHVLADLDLNDALQPHTTFPETIQLHVGRSGRILSTLPLGQSIHARFDAPYGVIHRGDLQSVLLERCSSSEHIEVEFDAEVITAEEHDDTIKAILKDGMRVEGSLLIAADGIWSSIRTELLGLSAPTDSGKLAWRALLPAKDVGDHWFLNATHVWLAPNAHAVTYPVSGGEQLNLIIITSNEASSASSGSPKPDDKFAPALLDLAEKVKGWTAWPLYETPLPYTLAKGRIALVGDAAHSLLPFAAQGAAMGIEDAAVITHAISHARDVKSALFHYEQARLDRVQNIAKFAKANGRIYHLPAPLAFFRNLGMRFMPPERLMRRQDWIYDWRSPGSRITY